MCTSQSPEKKNAFLLRQRKTFCRITDGMHGKNAIPPSQKLPDPWLADSEWLLKELAKTRETVLRIPFQLDNASDIKSAIDRIWNLERTVRELLQLHRAGQRSFAKQASAAQKKALRTSKKALPKIIRLHA